MTCDKSSEVRLKEAALGWNVVTCLRGNHPPIGEATDLGRKVEIGKGRAKGDDRTGVGTTAERIDGFVLATSNRPTLLRVFATVLDLSKPG